MIVLTAKIYINTTNAIEVDLDYSNLLSLERTVQDRSDLKLPSYGIISNKGNVSFMDSNGAIKMYADKLFLVKGQKVEIFLSNTVTGNRQKVASLLSDEWNYDGYEKSVSLSLKDNLEEWQNINIEGINYDPRKPEHKTFKDLYEYLYNNTPKKFNMVRFERLDETTKQFFSNSWLKYYLLEDGTLWQSWDKFSIATQSQIFQDNGKTLCRYVGGQ